MRLLLSARGQLLKNSVLLHNMLPPGGKLQKSSDQIHESATKRSRSVFNYLISPLHHASVAETIFYLFLLKRTFLNEQIISVYSSSAGKTWEAVETATYVWYSCSGLSQHALKGNMWWLEWCVKINQYTLVNTLPS